MRGLSTKVFISKCRLMVCLGTVLVRILVRIRPVLRDGGQRLEGLG